MRKVFSKTKKVVSLLLAMVMLLALVACGDTDTGNDNPNGGEDVELTHVEKLNEYFKDYPAIDLEGRTIEICMFWDAYYDSNHTSPEDNPNVADVETAQMMIDNVRRIEEKYNCRIEYVNPGSDALINSLNTSVVAGTPDYDAYVTQTWFAMGLALNDYFEEIPDLAKDYSKVNIDESSIDNVYLAGKNCFFLNSSLSTGAYLMVYNEDMIKELNLEDPNELYAKGEWTWEKFAELCAAATQDTDNNGEIDIYGYGGKAGGTISEFLASNNAELIKDGKENLSDEKVLETFNFLNKIYNEDKIAKPTTGDVNIDAFSFTEGKCAFSVIQLWILQSVEDMNFTYRTVPWPQGPSGDGSTIGKVYSDYYVIPKGVENPEAVFQVLEEFFGWHAGDLDLRDAGAIETVESILLTEEDVETYRGEAAKDGDDDWSMVDDQTGYVISGIFQSVITGEQTPAQAIEANKQVWQDAIDQVYASGQ